jgi:arylsulfatase A-like enzyme
VVDRCESILADLGAGRPFLGYLHFCDLHRPFDLAIAAEYSAEPLDLMPGIEDWDARAHSHDDASVVAFRSGRATLYAGLLNYVETQIERLYSVLERCKLLQDTTVVVTADHGEEFWDHLAFESKHFTYGKKSNGKPWLLGTGHGHTLFEELVHVPLVILNQYGYVHPGWADRPVSLVDIFPTVMAETGIEPSHNGVECDGQNLFSAPLERDLLIESPLYGFERKAVVRWPQKYIYSPFEELALTCNVLTDPTDASPMFGIADPDVLALMQLLFADDQASATSALGEPMPGVG